MGRSHGLMAYYYSIHRDTMKGTQQCPGGYHDGVAAVPIGNRADIVLFGLCLLNLWNKCDFCTGQKSIVYNGTYELLVQDMWFTTLFCPVLKIEQT